MPLWELSWQFSTKIIITVSIFTMREIFICLIANDFQNANLSRGLKMESISEWPTPNAPQCDIIKVTKWGLHINVGLIWEKQSRHSRHSSITD